MIGYIVESPEDLEKLFEGDTNGLDVVLINIEEVEDEEVSGEMGYEEDTRTRLEADQLG